MALEEHYTSDQIILYVIKSGYELVSTPRRGRYYLKHRTQRGYSPLIVPMGRDDLTSEYVKILLRNSPLNFTDFKKTVSSKP